MARDGNLRAAFRKNLPSWHWQSIESGGTGGGIPDSNFCSSGVEGWIEFKLAPGWQVTLRPAQVAWLSRRARAGGYCLVAVRQTRGSEDRLLLYRGEQAAALVDRGIRGVEPLASWEAPWPWLEVERVVLAAAREGFTRRR